MAGYFDLNLKERIKLLRDFNVKVDTEIADRMREKLAVSAEAADKYQQKLIDEALGYRR